MADLNYWNRHKTLKLYSLQRRRGRTPFVQREVYATRIAPTTLY